MYLIANERCYNVTVFLFAVQQIAAATPAFLRLHNYEIFLILINGF
ncbi:MAG: hypothetical protein LBP59_17915 [Planctomycetaceae bacterium]|nr:hypothetical protein [Planctomycetaceae bacterium]